MNKFKHTLRHILQEETEQSITSADTSTNQLPGVFKKVTWEPGTKNIDIGGGKYDVATEYLAAQDVTNYVYDPYNRTKEHNDAVMQEQPFDTATINNVLNVIPESEHQRQVLEMARNVVKPGGMIYIIVYEGDKSGIEKTTSKGYQHNKPTKYYLEIIKSVFPEESVILKNRVYRIQL